MNVALHFVDRFMQTPERIMHQQHVCIVDMRWGVQHNSCWALLITDILLWSSNVCGMWDFVTSVS